MSQTEIDITMANSIDKNTAPTIDKIVLVVRPELATGTLLNIAACLTAGITANNPQYAGKALQDQAGLRSSASSHLPVVVLKGNDAVFQRILTELTANASDGSLCIFPAYAQAIHQADQYWQVHQETVHTGEQISGLALSGTKKWLNRLTGNLALLR